MTFRHALAGAVGAVLFCLPPPAFAQPPLTTVVSGLTQPVFVGHAGDGSNRLFIVERGGKIRVAQPGSSTTTVFLDIAARLKKTGGEQGLLGLAFHPQYEINGRFFVFYTKAVTGAVVVAEYRASANPNVASTVERPLIEIAHPTYTNHNGGMLAFGPDGYLYVGVGDGGSGNDPNNHAQNKNSLLGKILRVDINTPGGYLSPTTNPFYGAVPGREEVFAYGVRNPWRFSFDRETGQLWIGDVGQGAREEIHTPIVNGGNYGWRVYEGTACTNLDPSRCNPGDFILPAIEYTHAGGRCSVTGGYVYRGGRNVFEPGTYLFGDYCTGEIWTRTGDTSTRILDTSMNISSFGEDETGELYVVNYTGGTVSRFGAPLPTCAPTINPTSRSIAWSGATGTVAVTIGASCAWTAAANASWLHITSGASGSGPGTVGYTADLNPTTSSRRGTLKIGAARSRSRRRQRRPAASRCRQRRSRSGPVEPRVAFR
jgi:hypothetical protein